MKRRDFISLFGGVAAAWPLAAQAQQAAMPVIGYLSGATFETMREYVAAFHRGLAVVQDAMTMLEIPSDESGRAPGRLLHARERDGGDTETLK